MRQESKYYEKKCRKIKSGKRKKVGEREREKEGMERKEDGKREKKEREGEELFFSSL